MNVILLSGGSGKRLWPLSNEVRSKQFLKVFKREDGTHESMLQRMHRMITEQAPGSTVTIATSENQVATIKAQLGNAVGISIEPCRRDTFPAIALATAYLHEVYGLHENEVAVVCPVDPYVDPDFFKALKDLEEMARNSDSNLSLIGVNPTYPSEKYGYIIPTCKDKVSTVSEFKEKPDAATAKEYISQGALWNAGVFAFRLKYVLDIAKKAFGTSDYKSLFSNYENLQKISFDYAVVEKEKNINVIQFAGSWKDLGTWNTLTEAMKDKVSGNAIAEDCYNTHVINELHIPLIALGCRNLAIVSTPDGILVTDKKSSDRLKRYVTNQRPMYEKRIWGEYYVLDYRLQNDGNNSLTKHLIINPGQHISYQKHFHRTEMWTIVEGSGKLILDGAITKIERGDTAHITAGTKHAIKADTELHIIEVQVGTELSEEDIERLEWDWEQNGL